MKLHWAEQLGGEQHVVDPLLVLLGRDVLAEQDGQRKDEDEVGHRDDRAGQRS